MTAPDGSTQAASRVVWWHTRGHPGDLHVLHTCNRGQQGCIALGHLYLGTNADNSRDAVIDGVIARGERNGMAKLTADDVRTIRAAAKAGESQRSIGLRHGVSATAVSDIVHRRHWKHVS